MHYRGMKRLLVGFDGSDYGASALQDLAHAGLPPELEAIVLSVADVWLPTNPAGYEPPLSEPVPVRAARTQALQAVASAQALAETAAERLRGLHPKWAVRAESRADSPAWALIRMAGEWHANLVAVGSHGRSVVERFFLGSVSQKVAAIL